MLRIDEPGEDSREQERPDDERDGAQTLDRSLQFALLSFAHAVSHHSLRCWKGNVPHRNHRDRSNVKPAGSGQTGNDHSDCSEKLTDVKCPPFTEPRNDSSGESAGNRRRKHAYNCKRNTNGGLVPSVTINRIKRPDDENFVRDVGEKLECGELPQFGMRSEQGERADRVGAAQCEFFTVFVAQRFRDENVAVEPVRQAKSGRNPEGQTRTDVCQRSTNSRAQNETDTKRYDDHAESAGAFFFRNNVGNIGHGSWNAGGSNSRNDPTNKQPCNCGRERHHDVIQAKSEIRQQDYRAPPESIGQHTQDRREEKLHQCEDSAENAKPGGCTSRVTTKKVQDELRQNRRDQSQGQHVEHDRDEDKNDRGFACFHSEIVNSSD